MSPPDIKQPFVCGVLETPAGLIPCVSSELTTMDYFGTFKSRWGIGRMKYTVDPGLYALGVPNRHSPVLITANYKMSFDRLRQSLDHRNAWILVLDTKGINVWCAAGKGTFGTDELCEKIKTCGLSNVVSHRELILPQLSAPGIAAHVIKKNTGFNIIYGPVRSSDLPAFIDSGYKATPDMRIKTFPLKDRAALIPMELIPALKWMLIILPSLFLLGGLIGHGTFKQAAIYHGLFAAFMLIGGLVAGTVITPLFLPWLPGRAFSIKGVYASIISFIFFYVFLYITMLKTPEYIEIFSIFILASTLAAFLAMNFTGSSTYTSLSGVRKEMKWAVPIQITAGVVGLIIWVGALVIG